MSEFNVITGVGGPSLYLNGYRIAGPKPWGGGKTIATFTADDDEIRAQLTSQPAAVCPICGGHGFVGVIEEDGDMRHSCPECNGTGKQRTIIASLAAAAPPTTGEGA